MDMNLLVALDALLSEGSVTAAAERMDISVPAMSRTLNRIRHMVGDPLLVRAGRGLVPTPRAEAMREGVHEWVRQAHALLQQTETFDFATLERTFTVRADDGIVSRFGPALLKALQQEAPGVTVRFTAQGQQDVAALREGRIDLDMGVIPDMGPEVVRQALIQDRFIILFRNAHPLAQFPQLELKQFLAFKHVTMSRRGLLSGPLDEALARRGHSRRIAVVTASFSAALDIARDTDLLATLPDRLTETSRHGLSARELPVQTPINTLSQAWHPRFNADPGHRALRRLFHRICLHETGHAAT